MSAYQQFQVIIQTEIYRPDIDHFLSKNSLATITIGTKPLIHYQLEYFEKYGFNKILIITKDTHFSKLKDVVDKYAGTIKPDDIDYHIVEEEKATDDELDTLTLMKDLHKHNKLKKDFIYLSGDLLLDETFNDVIDFHILKQSSLTVVFQEFPVTEPSKKDPKAPIIEEREDYTIMSVDKSSNRLLKLSKFQQDILIDRRFNIRKHTAARFPHSVILANCIQSGLLIAKREVANLLVSEELPDFSFEDCTNFEEEFIAYLVENQFNPKLIDALGGDIQEDEILTDSLSSVKQNFRDKFSIYAYLINKNFSKKIVTLADMFQANMACLVKPQALPTCFKSTPNNPELLEIQPVDKAAAKKAAQPEPAAAEPKQEAKEGKKEKKKPKKGEAAEPEEKKEEAPAPKEQAPATKAPENEFKDVTVVNSRIVKTTQLGEKTKIERSIIGPGCVIKKGAKVVNSVLMRGVVVEEDAIVEGSILFDKVTVGAKAKLKTCFVKGHMQIAEKQNLEKEEIYE